MTDPNGQAPLLGWVDEPTGPDVPTRGLPWCRFRGWMVSTTDRRPRVVVHVGDDPPLEFGLNESRPDVVEALAGEITVADAGCGFRFDLPLPEFGGEYLPVTIELTDGDVVARRQRYRIRRTPDDRPPRADYKEVWNAVAAQLDHAKLAVAGYTDEEEFERMAHLTVSILRDTVGIGAGDVVLEIGAGVGRVGPAIAPLCRHWIAADVSENMLDHARKRLAGFDNVDFVTLNGWDLAPIPSASVDVVYSTVVFMHLDEWDRYNYVCEGIRVLRPGGRMYVDNINLLGDHGWDLFMSTLSQHHPLERPPNVSKSSTPEELRTYFQRAGFADVEVQASSMWIWVHGTKPAEMREA